MMDYGDSSNVIPFKVCEKLNVKPEQYDIQIIQLDRTKFKVIGEIRNVLIKMSSNPKIHQTIDIIVVDIPDTSRNALEQETGLLHLKGIFPQTGHTFGYPITVIPIKSGSIENDK
jgi:hypothetical protein